MAFQHSASLPVVMWALVHGDHPRATFCPPTSQLRTAGILFSTAVTRPVKADGPCQVSGCGWPTHTHSCAAGRDSVCHQPCQTPTEAPAKQFSSCVRNNGLIQAVCWGLESDTDQTPLRWAESEPQWGCWPLAEPKYHCRGDRYTTGNALCQGCSFDKNEHGKNSCVFSFAVGGWV